MPSYKKKYKSSTIRGKFSVYNELKASKKIERLLPHTVPLTSNNLKLMTQKYKSVYLKPDIGSLGIGVCKLVHSKQGYALYTTAKKKPIVKQFRDRSTVYKYLKTRYKQRMIVQKDIQLDQVLGRPYDIRAMVQRKPQGPWTCTGLIVKVGRKNNIVTNYYQGGQIFTIQKYFKFKRCSPNETRSRIRSLLATAVDITRTLSKKHTGMHEAGIDLAYDNRQRLWILEVNTYHPQFRAVKKIDAAAYRRMAAYARSYGRRDD